MSVTLSEGCKGPAPRGEQLCDECKCHDCGGMKADPSDTYCPWCEEKYCGCGRLKEDRNDRLCPICQDIEDEARPNDDDGPDDDDDDYYRSR
jgi:hypothetical protein